MYMIVTSPSYPILSGGQTVGHQFSAVRVDVDQDRPATQLLWGHTDSSTAAERVEYDTTSRARWVGTSDGQSKLGTALGDREAKLLDQARPGGQICIWRPDD
jgi:hypothetical protein